MATTSYCTDGGGECQNGGVCILRTDQNGGVPANYCQCPEGTSGELCHGKDVCPLKCEHGSSCRHYNDISHGAANDSTATETAGFYCECVGNYKGKLCEVPFTTCPKNSDYDETKDDPLQCLYGGECVVSTEEDSDPTIYSCSCPKGRSGTSCENGQTSTIVDYNGSCFANQDCKNGGLCVRKHDPKTTEETGMFTKNTYCQCPTGYVV